MSLTNPLRATFKLPAPGHDFNLKLPSSFNAYPSTRYKLLSYLLMMNRKLELLFATVPLGLIFVILDESNLEIFSEIPKAVY